MYYINISFFLFFCFSFISLIIYVSKTESELKFSLGIPIDQLSIRVNLSFFSWFFISVAHIPSQSLSMVFSVVHISQISEHWIPLSITQNAGALLYLYTWFSTGRVHFVPIKPQIPTLIDSRSLPTQIHSTLPSKLFFWNRFAYVNSCTPSLKPIIIKRHSALLNLAYKVSRKLGWELPFSHISQTS